jgi:cyanophycinase-like exopeptidase
MSFLRHVAVVAVLVPSILQAQAAARRAADTKVGPPRGTVVVVGGGSMGPEIYAEFIKAAGGPDALIIDVPNAGGGESYGQDAAGTRGLKAAGAKNVYVLHTRDRKIADTDSFVAVIKKAGGVWFDGGRQFHLVNDYGGTKTEAAFREVLERGGVVGGSSAGASILGDFLVRGAPSSNNRIMDYPGYQKGTRPCSRSRRTKGPRGSFVGIRERSSDAARPSFTAERRTTPGRHSSRCGRATSITWPHGA